MGGFIDLTGKTFERLTVIKRVDNSKNNQTMWLCRCNCDGKEKVILGNDLRQGKTKSCGCLGRENSYKASKKYNTYDLTGEYGIGYTTKGEEFYFDLEDYDKIKDICWYKNSDGYLINVNRHVEIKTTWIHKVIMKVGNDQIVDHDDHNTIDNRKKNLRVCTSNDNNRNQTISDRNTSGIIGVYLDKKNGYWFSRVTINYKVINLGYYSSKYDAIKARLLGEIKYYKEFAPQKHLFKEYGIII